MAQITDDASLAHRTRPIRSSNSNALALFWPTRQADPTEVATAEVVKRSRQVVCYFIAHCSTGNHFYFIGSIHLSFHTSKNIHFLYWR